MASERLRNNIDVLSYMCRCSAKSRRAIIDTCDKKLIDCISECCLNILKGNIELTDYQKSKLKGYRVALRKMARKSTPVAEKRSIMQRGGFAAAVLAPLAMGVLSPVISKIMGKIVK